MESIVKEQMLNYLLLNKLITKHQHGFLSKHSTCSQLIECTNDWSLALNARTAVDSVYVDFSKAFDSVSHFKLSAKLKSFGIGGKLDNWITSFLTNRSQCVKVGTSFSSISHVVSGVPQGSVLGPLLFLLYINDIATLFVHPVTIKLYADDVKIYVVINDIQDTVVLQHGLDNLVEWSCKWQLSISVGK